VFVAREEGEDPTPSHVASVPTDEREGERDRDRDREGNQERVEQVVEQGVEEGVEPEESAEREESGDRVETVARDVPEVRASPGKEASSSDSPKTFKPFDVDDLTTEQQVQELSVRQMKLLLTRNFVDYKGCCEKEELLEKALRLWKERQQANEKDPDDIPDSDACKICMESAIDCVLLECGHMVTCTKCGKRLNECPICRQYVVRAVRIFKS
jgi:hypothetical protein